MIHEPKWVSWVRELQAIAQTGLHFADSEYDRERYRRIQNLAQNEIPALSISRVTPEQIQFCFEMQQQPHAPPRFD
jgi:hydrolase of X-linked nucleoside diphosphate